MNKIHLARHALQILKSYELKALADYAGLDLNHYNTYDLLIEGILIKLNGCYLEPKINEGDYNYSDEQKYYEETTGNYYP